MVNSFAGLDDRRGWFGGKGHGFLLGENLMLVSIEAQIAFVLLSLCFHILIHSSANSKI
jgi:hypothetical protein